MQSEQTLTVDAPGVLQFDTDSSSTSLTATLVQGTSHGALYLLGDGSFSYTPYYGFTGTDNFTYIAEDSPGTSPRRPPSRFSSNPP